MPTTISTKPDSGEDLISESRFMRLAGIKEEKQMENILDEKTKNARSEVSYSSSKASRKAYNKSQRAEMGDEIESQLMSTEQVFDDRTIGEIVPIGAEEWESYDGISSDPENNMPSEKLAYLYDLAYDVADGRVEMSEDDISALDALTTDAFDWSFSYSVTGHGADFSDQASRDELYDDYDDEPQWDEADQDYADQQYAEKHGNPFDDEDDVVAEGEVSANARLARLAGLKERMETKKVWK